MDDRAWFREGGFVGGVIGLRGAVYCWLGAMEVASDPLTDSAPASRTVTFDREGDIVDRLARLEGFFSSEVLDLDDLWLVRGEETSFSDLDDFLGGVSARAVLLDLLSPSFFDRRLDEDRLTSVLILMLAFFFALSELFSSASPTALPFRGEDWSRPVNGGLGGA